jgi:hypothetical protein
MKQSESIAKLTEALSKAQACIKGAITDSENPFFKSKYADLASVWDACRKPLTDNGLAIIQVATFIPECPEKVAIETTLSHSSGEFVSGIMAAKPVKDDPQSIGSCITYLRRYSLAAICGVSPEDDDGNVATGKTTDAKKQPPTKKKEEDVPEHLGEPPPEKPQGGDRKILEVMIQKAGVDRETVKEYLASVGWVTEVEGKLSMTTLSEKNVKTIVSKWDSFVKQVGTFADKRNEVA